MLTEQMTSIQTSSQIEPQKIISLKKFIFLSIITFSAYDIWWMFTAWRFFQQKDKSKIMPALRAIFAIFFLYPLLKRIKKFSTEEGDTPDYSPALLFKGYIFFLCCTNYLIHSVNFIRKYYIFHSTFSSFKYCKKKIRTSCHH
jgi:uncharacterized membrane protein